MRIVREGGLELSHWILGLFHRNFHHYICIEKRRGTEYLMCVCVHRVGGGGGGWYGV